MAARINLNIIELSQTTTYVQLKFIKESNVKISLSNVNVRGKYLIQICAIPIYIYIYCKSIE